MKPLLSINNPCCPNTPSRIDSPPSRPHIPRSTHSRIKRGHQLSGRSYLSRRCHHCYYKYRWQQLFQPQSLVLNHRQAQQTLHAGCQYLASPSTESGDARRWAPTSRHWKRAGSSQHNHPRVHPTWHSRTNPHQSLEHHHHHWKQ
jgi:hypothetical protein